MWTPATRGRMAAIERKTKRYPTDLTDEEWARVEPLLPRRSKRGRPREVDLREIMNAIRYLVRTGCGWRMLPNDFPPWETVYWWFRRFVRQLLFRTIHDLALMLDRERAGREASPSAGILDSQSVKAPAARQRGYDAGKKILGRKRHVAVDSDGRLLMVNLTTADISDSAGAQMILEAVRRLTDPPGFTVLPRRWVVERTLGWMIRWRRLVRDYEQRIDVSEAMIHVALGGLLLRRVSH